MKIIEPSVELIDEIDSDAIYKKIERCGRVCYQSQPKIFRKSKVSGGSGDYSIRGHALSEEDIREDNPYEASIPLDSARSFVNTLIDNGHESVLEHVSLTFHIICDRAIMAELTRHRLASFSVESTRYVKYDELEIISPFPVGDIVAETHWLMLMREIESKYRMYVDVGVKPEVVRAILPQCLKSELYMTANLREWRHILKLRTAEAAHPQMKKIAKAILAIFKEKLPVIVGDIKNEND